MPMGFIYMEIIITLVKRYGIGFECGKSPDFLMCR